MSGCEEYFVFGSFSLVDFVKMTYLFCIPLMRVIYVYRYIYPHIFEILVYTHIHVLHLHTGVRVNLGSSALDL